MRVRSIMTGSIVGMFTWLLTLAALATVRGEPFVDAYGGWTRTRHTDVSASQQMCFFVGCTQPMRTAQHVAFRSGAAAGLRAGWWSDRLPWLGIAGDLSYFQAPSAQVRLDSLSLAATPMVRLPLFITPSIPHGRLQPYIGAGPTLVLHDVWADFRPSSPITLTGWSIAVGWTARAGLAVPISQHFALFSEWRLSQDRVAVQQNSFFGAGEQGRLDLTQTTRHYLFGMSYRF